MCLTSRTLLLIVGICPFFATAEERRIDPLYRTNCAVCHGDNLQGAAQGTPLIGELTHGDSVDEMIKSISEGFPDKGMPEWRATLTDQEIKGVALWIAEARQGIGYATFNYDTPFEVPTATIMTELHDFRMEVVAEDLAPQPYSIAPLADGSILLTEKSYGLSVIARDGSQSPYIEDTPKTYTDNYIIGPKQEWGNGWMLEVAPHPDYAENGWLYMHIGDRPDADQRSSMNKILRGRIKDGKWVDQETIWEADRKFYGGVSDLGRGGRLAFDGKGHVFFTVGLGIDNHKGVQDLSTPFGKTHRVREDGTIPLDNPFVATQGAMHSIWTYGHRSPQGLEYRQSTGDLWGTEHGPRGGDEVNHLRPGKNFGWPLYSKGNNYDGSRVEYGKALGIEFDLDDIEQPVVDLTPSPAVSSFIFYEGDDFPDWRGDLLVGSLKARTLYRVRLDGNKLVHKETIFRDVARIRDIEAGPNGEVYVLFEHNSGSKIVRLVPQSS